MTSILLFKNTTIEKRLLSGGKGDVPDFIDGTKVEFHYQTRLCDDDHTVLDDSHSHNKPLELYLGKKFKLEVWETCIKSMRLNEVASFTVQASAASCYPLVAKSLRDINRGKKPAAHCCGNALQTLGYTDLDKLMKNPQPLEFILDLIKVDNAGEFRKEIWAMDDKEKLAIVPTLREEGNSLYKKNEYKEAGRKYAAAIGILEQLTLKERPGDELWMELEEMKVPLLLNYSQCGLLLGEYYQVIEHTSEVLKKHPDNVKALFRRGRAHIEAWNPELARKDFSKALQLDEMLAKAVNTQLHILNQKEVDKNKKDKAAFQGKMFH